MCVVFHTSHRSHPATLTGHAHTSDLTAGLCVRRGTASGFGEACNIFIIIIIIMIIYSILIFEKPGGQKQRVKKRPKRDAKAALELLSHLKKRTSIFGNRKLPASKSDLENRPENRQKTAT